MDCTPTCKKSWEQLDEEELAFIEEDLLGTAEDLVWIGESDINASGSNNE